MPEAGIAKLLNLNENDSRLDYRRICGRAQALFGVVVLSPGGGAALKTR